MSNKTQLQTNNTALDTLITRVNAAKDVAASLPEAGGGSGGGTQTYSITVDASSLSKSIDLNVLVVSYTKPDGTAVEDALCITGIYTQTYNDVGAGLFIIYDAMEKATLIMTPVSYSAGVTMSVSLANLANIAAFNVYGDSTITIG